MLIQLTPTAAAAVRRGHPWVFREGLVSRDGRGHPPRQRATGDVVELGDGKAFVARGLWDADSPIAVRVFERSAGRALNIGAVSARVERAIALRDTWFPDDTTTAYRLCNGEGDHVPSLVIDRYAHVAVLRLDGGILLPWLDRLVPRIASVLTRRGVRTLGLRATADTGTPEDGKKITLLHGPPLPDRLVVRESGMAMEVDLARGQKTGAFLDQRDNRARVRALASGRARALNLFSYAGGFSLAAALGGAAHVTSVDSAAAAHATAQRSFRENGLDPTQHDFITADAFDFLDKAHARGDRWDLIVSDPPSFAPSERAKPRALAAYRRLHGAIARVLTDGGVFCAASCSSHVTAEDFATTLDHATLDRDDLRLCALLGQPPDHPTLPAWPEGRYLKMAVLA
ncbi:class I SAM-dependent rRNA methyltransferase [Chondromyces crocatus]|uniref:SAM-dependent methyltransferase n=1 Tax=Chondromyces crocatus TaxID=52 RepID=A0A0K1ESE8_CHOCO|nr:class I SAM-dependent rRNA methyltransferase [Chondromyces crocatus]AKT43791.1 SAM-dependent methyltransferase [Chondromyces crocatus]